MYVIKMCICLKIIKKQQRFQETERNRRRVGGSTMGCERYVGTNMGYSGVSISCTKWVMLKDG